LSLNIEDFDVLGGGLASTTVLLLHRTLSAQSGFIVH